MPETLFCNSIVRKEEFFLKYISKIHYLQNLMRQNSTQIKHILFRFSTVFRS